MGRVVVSADARRDLGAIISSHHLPADARTRVQQCLVPLATYPLIGPVLRGTYRYVLGPWPWMLLVYRVDRHRDTIVVVTIEDARHPGDATGDE